MGSKPGVRAPTSNRLYGADGAPELDSRMTDEEKEQLSCPVPAEADLSNLTVINLQPAEAVLDYRTGMRIANAEAQRLIGEYMLLSWHDRDRNFESPQHASECHQDSAVPGYVDYGVHHGATLKVDIDQGRFVFFYLPVEDS